MIARWLEAKKMLICFSVGLFIIALNGCGGGKALIPSQPSSQPPKLSAQDQSQLPLRIRFQTDKSRYRQGETVKFIFTIENHGDKPFPILQLPQPFDAEIRHKGKDIVLRLSQVGLPPPPVIIDAVIQPGETFTSGWVWEQVDQQWKQVPPGTYTAQGWLRAGDISEAEARTHFSATTKFRIRARKEREKDSRK